MWQKLGKAFNSLLNGAGKSKIVSAILKALGVSGGFWTWIVSFFVGKATKKIGAEAESQGRQADRKISDKEVREKYMEKVKENASEDELIKSELDIWNPKRGR